MKKRHAAEQIVAKLRQAVERADRNGAPRRDCRRRFRWNFIINASYTVVNRTKSLCVILAVPMVFMALSCENRVSFEDWAGIGTWQHQDSSDTYVFYAERTWRQDSMHGTWDGSWSVDGRGNITLALYSGQEIHGEYTFSENCSQMTLGLRLAGDAATQIRLQRQQ